MDATACTVESQNLIVATRNQTKSSIFALDFDKTKTAYSFVFFYK